MIAVVVLAGGEGSRIGGGKPLRRLGGETMLGRALALARGWSDRIAVAARSAAQVGDLDVPVLPDAPGIDGPLAGLVAAMQWAEEHGHSAVLTIPCDTPFLPPDLPDRLGAASGSGVALAASGGVVHAACGLWRTAKLAALPAYLATGRRSLIGFAQAVGFERVEWPAEPFDPFFNVNSAADLERADRLLR